jgi:hypothetical protein
MEVLPQYSSLCLCSCVFVPPEGGGRVLCVWGLLPVLCAMYSAGCGFINLKLGSS